MALTIWSSSTSHTLFLHKISLYEKNTALCSLAVLRFPRYFRSRNGHQLSFHTLWCGTHHRWFAGFQQSHGRNRLWMVRWQATQRYKPCILCTSRLPHLPFRRSRHAARHTHHRCAAPQQHEQSRIFRLSRWWLSHTSRFRYFIWSSSLLASGLRHQDQ